MQTTADILRVLNEDRMDITSAMLHDLIDQNELERAGRERAMHDRYTQDSVPVQSKVFADYEKVAERIPNDFFGDIVDVKTGYLGNEISITINEKLVENDAERQRQAEFLHKYALMNRSADRNSELVKGAAMSGRWFRLLYSTPDRGARVMNVPAWECNVYRDAGIDEPTFGMRYYKVEEKTYVPTGAGATRPNAKKRWRVEWYDRQFVTYYRENWAGRFELDDSRGLGATPGRQPHLFDGVPLLEFRNNEEGMAEAEKALELIDAYDNIMSDATSEVEQLRMAYMFLKGSGMLVDSDFIKRLRQTGIFPLPVDGDLGFASKDLGGAGTFVKQILDEIRRNIYAFAKSIDLSEDRGGDMRVIGWQIALLRMEMSSQVTERKFRSSYLQQYELLTKYWRKFGQSAIDPYTLRFEFTRKFPRDLAQEVTTLLEAQQALPLEAAYGLMSFIEDPKEMAEKFREEQLGPIPNVEAVPAPEGTLLEAGPEGGNVEEAAMNGAQIGAMVEVVQAVSAGELAPESAIQMLMVAMPSMGEARARAIVEPAVRIQITKPVPPQFTPVE